MNFNPQPSTTAKSSKLKLSVLLNSTLFGSGSRITGKLEITVLNDVLIKDINLRLEGYEEIDLKNYHQTKSILSLEKRFQGDSLPISRVCQGPKTRDGYYPGKRGKTVFEFGLDLPLDCPSSFVYHHSSVKYLITASIQFKQSVNHCSDTLFKTVDLAIIQRIDPTLVQGLKPLAESQNSCKVLFGGDYPVTMTASINSAYLTTSSSFPLTLTVDNASKKKLSGLKLQFLKRLAMINPSPDQDVKSITEVIQTTSFKEYSFGPQEESTITLHPTLPDIYTIMNTNLSQITYFLLVSLSIPLFKELNVELFIQVYHPKSFEPVKRIESLLSDGKEDVLPEPTLPNTDCIDLEVLELSGTIGRTGDRSGVILSDMSSAISGNISSPVMGKTNPLADPMNRRVSFETFVKAYDNKSCIKDRNEEQVRIDRETNKKSDDIYAAEPYLVNDFCEKDLTRPRLSQDSSGMIFRADLDTASQDRIETIISRRRNSMNTFKNLSVGFGLDNAKDLSSVRRNSSDSLPLQPLNSEFDMQRATCKYPTLPVRKTSAGSIPNEGTTTILQQNDVIPVVPRRNSVEHFNTRRLRVVSEESKGPYSKADDAPSLPYRNSLEHFNRKRGEFLSPSHTTICSPEDLSDKPCAFSTISSRILPLNLKASKHVQPRLPSDDIIENSSSVGFMLESALAFLDLSPNCSKTTVETTFSKRIIPESEQDQETYLRKENIHREFNLPLKYNSRHSNTKSKSTLRRKPLPKPSDQPKMPPKILDSTFFDEDEDRTRTIRTAKIVSTGFDSEEEDAFWN